MNQLPALNGGNRTALLAKLDLKGNAGDVGKVRAFISLTGDLLTAGKIAPADASALLALANGLLDSLLIS